MYVLVVDGIEEGNKKQAGWERRDGRGGIEVRPSYLHRILLKKNYPKHCHHILLIMILQKCVLSCKLFSFSQNNTIKIANVQSH